MIQARCLSAALIAFLTFAWYGTEPAEANRGAVFGDGLYLPIEAVPYAGLPTDPGGHHVAGCEVEIRKHLGKRFVKAEAARCLGEEIDTASLEPRMPEPVAMLNWSVKPPAHAMRVVIDPGHGGHDAGAVGLAEVPEKDIVLGIAKRLAERLGEDPAVEVYLTRTDDRYLTLRQRNEIANRLQADLFVSIHCNSGRRVAAKGVEVFVAGRQADDDAAMEVAAAENAGEEAYLQEYDPSDILSELAAADQLQHSAMAAKQIVTTMTGTLATENRGVKRAPFWVLLGSNMPAVLVESGFVTNPEEGHRLPEVAYQEQIAASIGEALTRLKPIFLARREKASDGKIAQSSSTGTPSPQIQPELAP